MGQEGEGYEKSQRGFRPSQDGIDIFLLNYLIVLKKFYSLCFIYLYKVVMWVLLSDRPDELDHRFSKILPKLFRIIIK